MRRKTDYSCRLIDSIDRLMSKRSRIPYKVLLVGEGGVGKTTYIGKFNSLPGSTEMSFYDLPFYTTRGLIVLRVVEEATAVAGQHWFEGLIAMYDLTKPSTKEYAVQALRATIPSVLVATKADLTPVRDANAICVSSKTNYKCEVPIITLIRKMELLRYGDDSIEFVDAPAI